MLNEQYNEIANGDLDIWNQRLLSTTASYRQYPYWNEPYRLWRFNPIYLTLGNPEDPDIYLCLLAVDIPPFRFGLVQCGPVSLRPSQKVDAAVLRTLLTWAERHGFTFLRLTHSDSQLLSILRELRSAQDLDAFPFYRDPRNKLIVHQLEDDQEMLNSFQKVARYEIRAATRAGYEISSTDQPEALTEVWPMFETLARRKGFGLHARPLSTWVQAMRLARPHQCARLYRAALDGRTVESLLVMRYGDTAEYMLGALDVEKLQGKVSPSCLLHWTAMRDFHNAGCLNYNLGGPGDMKRNMVFQFKRKFHPVLEVNPPPVTLILKPRLYRLWAATVLGIYVPWLSRLRRIRARFQARAKR